MKSIAHCIAVFVLIGYSDQLRKHGNHDGTDDGSGRHQFLQHGSFNQCQGKDASNFTFIVQYSKNDLCEFNSGESEDNHYLISSVGNGTKRVNTLTVLSASQHPLGAYIQVEGLYLVTSGDLEGKYAFVKEIYQSEEYLKKCSSVLGAAYVTTKSQVLMISDHLNVNIFTNPSGAYETFHQSSGTICQGGSIIV